jgi:hypothetical protein
LNHSTRTIVGFISIHEKQKEKEKKTKQAPKIVQEKTIMREHM